MHGSPGFSASARPGRAAGLASRLAPALVGGLVLIALVACSQARFTPATIPVELEPYTGEVRVLERLPPPNEYVAVGVVIAEGVFLTKQSDMLEDLKRAAARRGANAVVLQGKVKITKTGTGGEEKKLAAWAIRTND